MFLWRQNTALDILCIEIPLSEDELVSCRLAVLKVHAQLWKREVGVRRGSSNGARCASVGSHFYIDGISYEVRHGFIPDLGVEDVGRAKFAVLTARESDVRSHIKLIQES
jgi:hypothetical protein